MRVAGRLREIAVVQRPTRVSNGSGGWTTTYADVLNPMHCDVKQKSVSADMIASQQAMIQPFEFVTRYRPDLTLEIGDRITWRGRKFSLISFRWDVMRTKLIITASTDNETTSDGSNGT